MTKLLLIVGTVFSLAGYSQKSCYKHFIVSIKKSGTGLVHLVQPNDSLLHVFSQSLEPSQKPSTNILQINSDKSESFQLNLFAALFNGQTILLSKAFSVNIGSALPAIRDFYPNFHSKYALINRQDGYPYVADFAQDRYYALPFYFMPESTEVRNPIGAVSFSRDAIIGLTNFGEIYVWRKKSDGEDFSIWGRHFLTINALPRPGPLKYTIDSSLRLVKSFTFLPITKQLAVGFANSIATFSASDLMSSVKKQVRPISERLLDETRAAEAASLRFLEEENAIAAVLEEKSEKGTPVNSRLQVLEAESLKVIDTTDWIASAKIKSYQVSGNAIVVVTDSPENSVRIYSRKKTSSKGERPLVALIQIGDEPRPESIGSTDSIFAITIVKDSYLVIATATGKIVIAKLPSGRVLKKMKLTDSIIGLTSVPLSSVILVDTKTSGIFYLPINFNNYKN